MGAKSSVTGVLLRRGKFEHRHGGEPLCEDGVRDWTGFPLPLARVCLGLPEVGRVKEISSPRALPAGIALHTP